MPLSGAGLSCNMLMCPFNKLKTHAMNACCWAAPGYARGVDLLLICLILKWESSCNQRSRTVSEIGDFINLQSTQTACAFLKWENSCNERSRDFLNLQSMQPAAKSHEPMFNFNFLNPRKLQLTQPSYGQNVNSSNLSSKPAISAASWCVSQRVCLFKKCKNSQSTFSSVFKAVKLAINESRSSARLRLILTFHKPAHVPQLHATKGWCVFFRNCNPRKPQQNHDFSLKSSAKAAHGLCYLQNQRNEI